MTKEEKMYEAPDGTMLTYEEFQELCKELKAQELAGMDEPGSSSWSDEEIKRRLEACSAPQKTDFAANLHVLIEEQLSGRLGEQVYFDIEIIEPTKLRFFNISKSKKKFDFDYMVFNIVWFEIPDAMPIDCEAIRIDEETVEFIITFDVGPHVVDFKKKNKDYIFGLKPPKIPKQQK
ncbi:hypothetical protein ACK3Z8_00845 [Aeromonas caviae]